MTHRTWRDEKGFSFVITGLGLTAFLAAMTLAIDVGMFVTARSQAQNSADSAALAGATALVFDDYNDRSAGGPAVQNALNAAKSNAVMGSSVAIDEPDVTFPLDANGQPTLVRVEVHRDRATGNAIPTLFGSLFGVKNVNVNAIAVGQAAPANAVSCVKPFMIPDKWVEMQTPPWDASDTFEMYDNKNKLLANPDIYIPAGEPGYSGYDATRDKGTLLVIRAGTGNNIEPSMYFSWKMTSAIGGDYYRDNIDGCNPSIVHWGDPMIQEPGDMSGPTNQGIDELIASDPTAYWNGSKVVSSMHPSPRIFPIPLYDPAYYASGKANGRDASFRVANWIGFFVESRSGNQIYGRICPLVGVIDPNAGPAPAGAFPRTVRLVQ